MSDLEALAALPANAPWGIPLLAAVIAHGTPGTTRSVVWEGAPPELRLLADAVARAGSFRLSRPSGRRYDTAYALVVGPDRLGYPTPDGRQAYELARGEDGFVAAVAWAEGEPAQVYWLDTEDGSGRREDTLDGFCRGILLGSLRAFEEPEIERSPDYLYLTEDGIRRLQLVLEALATRRAELIVEATRAVARCEAEIHQLEANGNNSDDAYGALEAALLRQEALGTRGPWPRPREA